ncbi:MAG: hypothetical protein ACFFDN_43040, partial [Candidatus Hodarchaeota archaeon]
MLNIFQLNSIRFARIKKVRNLLNSSEIEKYKDSFIELFGKARSGDYNGNRYYVSEEGLVFCYYSMALAVLRNFGARSEIVLKDNLWRIKTNGKWYLLSEYFGFLSEDLLNKAKKLLRPERKLYLRWPFQGRDY